MGMTVSHPLAMVETPFTDTRKWFPLGAYWPDQAILDGKWQPPAIEKVQ
jgi:hypothetical protein